MVTLPGHQYRQKLRETVISLVPTRSRPIDDFSGWTDAEFLAYVAAPPGSPLPPRRVGREAALRINALSGSLPLEATLLARTITDAAPPPGMPVNRTLSDVLTRYLPESLTAFTVGGAPGIVGRSEELLIAQLRLLHQVTTNVLRAEAEHNDRDLHVQEAFLRDRFADLTPSSLTLPHPPTATASRPPTAATAPRAPAAAPATPRARAPRYPTANPGPRRVHVDPVTSPTALFDLQTGDRKLSCRLAIPRGQVCTLGCVYETLSGATGFVHSTSHRWLAQKRPTGFRAPQVDVTLRLPTQGLKRFLVYVTGPAKGTPIRSVLFVRDAAQNQAEVATLIANHVGATTTVIASGAVTADGLVLRNESTLYPNLRAACEGFGHGTISWLDADTPIV